MNNLGPLFDNLNSYPHRAGDQGGDTDIKAAKEIESTGRANTLRLAVLRIMQARPLGLTADETAALLGVSILSIRPRLTELKLQGRLYDTGIRRPSSQNKSQRVLAIR